ncbi:hypothetical protein BGZ57DRAFT_228312 [Hyaloscypha finlandica]|nr:hypothetical protein BGZ57DRAFT_228312 [Hyaloscypha finlandica]
MGDNFIDFNFVEVNDNTLEYRLPNFGREQQKDFTGQDRLKENIVLCGRRINTIHGQHDGVPHTLIIFEWYVHARTPRKRFKFVQIGVKFESSRNDPDYHPVIIEIAPRGSYALEETEDQVEKTRGWTPSASLGIHGTATLGTGYEYKLTRSGPRQDRIIVNGMSLFGEGSSDPDRHYLAEWNLFENETAKTGVPRYFRTAVLLKRREDDMSPFTARFSIKTNISFLDDAGASLKKFRGLQVKDDPIIFNPNLVEYVPRFLPFVTSLGNVHLENESVFMLFRGSAAPLKGREKKDEEKDEKNNKDEKKDQGAKQVEKGSSG